MERIIDTHCRADAIQLLHDAAKALGTIEHSQKLADDARIRQVRAAIDALDRLSSQLDAVESAMAKRQREDEEAERAQLQHYLDGLPDPDNPATYDPPGDLHILQPTDDQGNLPKELLKEAPPDPGTDPVDPSIPDPASKGYPPKPGIGQPISVSLNEG